MWTQLTNKDIDEDECHNDVIRDKPHNGGQSAATISSLPWAIRLLNLRGYQYLQGRMPGWIWCTRLYSTLSISPSTFLPSPLLISPLPLSTSPVFYLPPPLPILHPYVTPQTPTPQPNPPLTIVSLRIWCQSSPVMIRQLRTADDSMPAKLTKLKSMQEKEIQRWIVTKDLEITGPRAVITVWQLNIHILNYSHW